MDVEDVRITDTKIGTTNDADLITLADNSVTIAGGLTTTTMAVTSTFGVTSDFAVNTDKFIVNATNGNTKMTGNLEMSGDTATLTHSGSTGVSRYRARSTWTWSQCGSRQTRLAAREMRT